MWEKKTNWNSNTTKSIDQLIAKRPHTIEWIHFWFHFMVFRRCCCLFLQYDLYKSATIFTILTHKKLKQQKYILLYVCRLNHQRLKCCNVRCLSCIIGVLFFFGVCYCLFVWQSKSGHSLQQQQNKCVSIELNFYLIFRLKAQKI